MAVDGAPLLFTAVFFVFLNLHHLIDAVIWRSNGEIARSMVTPSARPTPVAGRPAATGAHAPATT